MKITSTDKLTKLPLSAETETAFKGWVNNIPERGSASPEYAQRAAY